MLDYIHIHTWFHNKPSKLLEIGCLLLKQTVAGMSYIVCLNTFWLVRFCCCATNFKTGFIPICYFNSRVVLMFSLKWWCFRVVRTARLLRNVFTRSTNNVNTSRMSTELQTRTSVSHITLDLTCIVNLLLVHIACLFFISSAVVSLQLMWIL